MLIAQITDMHVAAPGAMVYDAIDTNAYLRAAIARLNALSPRPDLVLATGDLVDHGTEEEYRHLQALMSELQMPAYMILGNHDHRELFRAQFGDLDYLKHAGPYLNFAVETPRLRLLGVDTAVHGMPYGAVTDETLAWLEEELSRHPDRPTALFMHHPPFETGIWWMDAIGLHGRNKLAQIVQRRRNVRRILCGHLHRPIVAEWAGVLCSIAPSTAHHVDLDIAGTNFLNMLIEPPAFHLHVVGEDGGMVTHVCYVDVPTERFLPGDRIKGGLEAYQQRYRAMGAALKTETP